MVLPYYYFHRMLLAIIDKRDGLSLLRQTIHRNRRCRFLTRVSLRNLYVINGFTKAVVYGETIPIGGEAGRKRQLVRFQRKAQE